MTGPLLQLSSLYQGFQKVQLSMERLSDILDQNPELSSAQEIGQITMPLLKSSIRLRTCVSDLAGKVHINWIKLTCQ